MKAEKLKINFIIGYINMKNKNNNNLNNIREKPVFICGHPKSGTSLLRSMLDNHPELIVYPEETYFFRKFLPMSQMLSLKEQLDLAEEHLGVEKIFVDETRDIIGRAFLV